MIAEQNIFGGNMKNIELKINEYFRSLIPPLSDEELSGLRESILKEGCRDPIVVWQDYIIDGHHRYAICRQHNIAFKTIAAQGLESELDVEEWMIKNQIAKRNLTTIQKAEMALKLEDVERRKAKERQVRKPISNSVRSKSTEQKEQGKSLEKAAKAVGLGYDTVFKAKKVLEKAPEDIKKKVRSGKVSIDKAYRQIRKQERREHYAQMEWPKGKYRVIYADPPWSYGVQKEGHGGVTDHYDTLSLQQICDLPVRDLADKECVLFLWITVPLLESVFTVLKAWGFEYKTLYVWDKVRSNIGSYCFVNCELLLVATKENTALPPDGKKLFDNVVSIERSGKHSEKPEFFREMIDATYQFGNRIELFARKTVNNWEVWGNDVSQ